MIPHPPTDIPIKYHWKGQSKFGVFDFDTTSGHSVDFSLVSDGQVWRHKRTKGELVDVPKW